MNAANSDQPWSDQPEHGQPGDHGPGGHEELLQSALAGELPSEDARWNTLRDCAECAVRLEQLDELQRLLDAAGRDQSELLASLPKTERAPGVELVAPFVNAKLAETRPRVRAPLLSFRAWAATAAAATLVIGWFARQWSARSDGGAQGDRGVLLGEQRERKVHPEGDVADYLPFEWDIEAPPGGSFTLTVWDAELDDPEQALSTMSQLREKKAWIAAETVARWPNEIGWQVQALDATGAAVGAPRRAYAKLRNP